MQTRAADDFDFIRARMNQLKGEKGDVVERVALPPGFKLMVSGTNPTCKCGPGGASEGCFVEDKAKEGSVRCTLSGPCKRGYTS